MRVLIHAATKPSDLPDQKAEVPPLESGDRLTRAEFMRRYDAMPELKKAELIERVVYMPSPVRHKYHGRQHHHLLNWIGHYEAGTPGVEGSDNSTILLDLDNAPQPDGLLFSGLWLDPAALIRGDLATVLAVVQKGVDSPEHAEFVARLNRRA